MNYKLLAFDLDGTLVNKTNKISTKNMNAIASYIKRGGIVCFITGRSINSALKLADSIYDYTKTKIHFICSLNGSFIYDYRNSQVINLNPIDNKITHQIQDIFTKNNISYGVYNADSLKNNELWLFNCPLILKIIPFTSKHNKIKYKDYVLLNNVYKINVVKLLSKKKFNNIVNLLSDLDNIMVVKPSSYMIEITKNGIDKGYALKYICELLNIDLSETIAIGDSGNDIPMFKVCGKSIGIHNKKFAKHGFVPDHILNCKINEIADIVIKKEI